MSKYIYKCLICEKPVLDYMLKFCCDGHECSCGGVPINPCVCSSACDNALHTGIGKTFEQRRKDAGIEKFSAS